MPRGAGVCAWLTVLLPLGARAREAWEEEHRLARFVAPRAGRPVLCRKDARGGVSNDEWAVVSPHFAAEIGSGWHRERRRDFGTGSASAQGKRSRGEKVRTPRHLSKPTSHLARRRAAYQNASGARLVVLGVSAD